MGISTVEDALYHQVVQFPFVVSGEMSTEAVCQSILHSQKVHCQESNLALNAPVPKIDSFYAKRGGPCSSLFVDIINCCHLLRHDLNMQSPNI